METFAERLYRLRLEAGLTRQQLAEFTGLSASLINKYEKKTCKSPSIEAISLLASYFNTSIDYLYGKTDDVFSVNFDYNSNSNIPLSSIFDAVDLLYVSEYFYLNATPTSEGDSLEFSYGDIYTSEQNCCKIINYLDSTRCNSKSGFKTSHHKCELRKRMSKIKKFDKNGRIASKDKSCVLYFK